MSPTGGIGGGPLDSNAAASTAPTSGSTENVMAGSRRCRGRQQLGLVFRRERLGFRDERRLLVRAQRRRCLGAGRDGLADEGEELLLSRGCAQAEQPRWRAGGVGERVWSIRRHIDRLALAGNDRLAPEGDLDFAVKDREHLFEVMSMGWRAATGRHVHVDEGVLAGGVASGNEDRVRVADQSDVRQAFVLIGPRDRQGAREVIGRDGGGVGSHDSPRRWRGDSLNGGFPPQEATRYGRRANALDELMGHPVRRSTRERRSDAALNRDALVQAATAAVHREGLRVRMSTIAADAGVGIATLYRHFATREDLLNYLTHRSFEMVLANARAAESAASTGSDALRQFIEAAIALRDQLVLPLHGGPPVTDQATVAVRDQVHRTIAASHRPRPSRRHDQSRRQPSRHSRDRGNARPAETERPGLGRDLQADPLHLPRRSRVDWSVMTARSILTACRELT